MLKTKRTAMTLALGMLFVLFSTAFAAAPAQASGSRTASAPPPSRPYQQLQAGWGSWFEVPPGNGFTLSGPALTFDQVNDYVFIRGTNNHIYVNASSATGWSGWSEVPGHMLTPSAPAATTNGTTVSLFVRGTDNKIYTNTLKGTTWSSWSQVPGHGLTSDTPSALANGTLLSLVVRGTDNHIYMNTFDGTTWSGWSEVPGHGLTLSGPTSTFSTASGVNFLNLFVRGTNNHLYVNSTSNGTTWSGWSEVPGHGIPTSAPVVTTLYLTAGNSLYLFVRGTNNKLYVNTFANGTTWSSWSQVPGNGLTPDAPGATAAATNTSGTAGFVALSVRGSNNRIYLNVLQFP
jgi:hypothetical protein